MTRDSREDHPRGSISGLSVGLSINPSKNSLGSYRGYARGLYTKGNGAQTMLCKKKKWGLLWERNQWCYKGSKIKEKHGKEKHVDKEARRQRRR